jgi:8-oxo-dGTP diphosphatase
MRFFPSYLTADSLLIVGNEVLLVQRGHDPHKGRWAIPGGFVEEQERVLTAAERELLEETGISGVRLEQFATYGDPGRDPRGRVVCVVHWARLLSKPEATAGDDAALCEWFSLDNLPDMAFDHEQILQDVRERLKEEKDKEGK